MRVGDKDRCIPCREAILPASAQWVTDAAGSSCEWRCKVGHERLNDRRCAPCVGGLPRNAEWRRVDGDCAWRCNAGYAGSVAGGVDASAGVSGGGGVASSSAALAVMGRARKGGGGGGGGERCAKCVTHCDPGSFMVGEGDGSCPAGTARDARRCERWGPRTR
jgi:hypothetical protein